MPLHIEPEIQITMLKASKELNVLKDYLHEYFIEALNIALYLSFSCFQVNKETKQYISFSLHYNDFINNCKDMGSCSVLKDELFKFDVTECLQFFYDRIVSGDKNRQLRNCSEFIKLEDFLKSNKPEEELQLQHKSP